MEGTMTTEAYARSDDRPTSHAAAASVRMTEMEELVYRIVLDAPCTNGFMDGYTKDQVHAIQLEVHHHERDSISPRFAPLNRKGRITAIGERWERSGRRQTVWLDAERARARRAAGIADIDPGPVNTQ